MGNVPVGCTIRERLTIVQIFDDRVETAAADLHKRLCSQDDVRMPVLSRTKQSASSSVTLQSIVNCLGFLRDRKHAATDRAACD